MTARVPLHPGEILRIEFMEPLELSQAQLAAELSVSPSSVSRLVNEQADLTAQMALRLESRFGTSAEFWMNLQKSYELDIARRAVVA
ncbi:MAG TPA: HigA family addiction module antitoxin [Euzebya sp.]|nr:HigA family addiction module antitoxin [Euzebya sp.]